MELILKKQIGALFVL